MSFTGKTLEEFIEDQCGMVTPKLLLLLEPHREFVEQALINFDEKRSTWQEYSERLWTFLPEPQKDHFQT